MVAYVLVLKVIVLAKAGRKGVFLCAKITIVWEIISKLL